jgi:hypothetical protein
MPLVSNLQSLNHRSSPSLLFDNTSPFEPCLLSNPFLDVSYKSIVSSIGSIKVPGANEIITNAVENKSQKIPKMKVSQDKIDSYDAERPFKMDDGGKPYMCPFKDCELRYVSNLANTKKIHTAIQCKKSL